MATLIEYALISNAAYFDIRGDQNIPVIPEGWTRLDRTQFGLPSTPDTAGFSAEIFQNGTEIVIAFEGTNPDLFSEQAFKDLRNSFGLYLGFITSQLETAVLLYERVKTQLGSNITFTGHSLGGGLAGLMSTFFDRPAAVFAPAPFQNTVNPNNVQRLQQLLAQSTPDDPAINQALSQLVNIENSADSLVQERETRNITGYFVNGEVLDLLRFDSSTLARWPLETVPVGNTELGAMGRHSMLLHAAGLESPNFRLASMKLPPLLKLMADETLYAKKLSDQNEKDFLQRLLEFQFGAPGITPNDMLDRFGTDLVRIGKDNGLVAVSRVREGLILAGIEYYNFVEPALLADFFRSVPGGIRFDLDSINLARNEQKGYAKLREYVEQTYGPLLPDPSLLALDTRRWWYLQAGSGGMSATADTADSTVMIGGSVTDQLSGAAGNDLLLGGEGADILHGGSGDDLLAGGTGVDIYQYRPNDGNDTIVDQDGQGLIVYDDANGASQTLTLGTRNATDPANQYRSPDGTITYTVNASDLTIQTPTGRITVRDYTPRDLGLRLWTLPANPEYLVTDDGAAPTDDSRFYGNSTSPHLVLTGDGNDTVDGSQADDRLILGLTDPNGQDRDYDFGDGREGNDLIEGGANGDILIGGSGDDRLFAGTEADLATVSLAGQIPTADSDWLAGGSGLDLLIGSRGDNALFGGGADDVLLGGAGNDSLMGDSTLITADIGWTYVETPGTRVREFRDAFGTIPAFASGAGGNDEIYGNDGDDWIIGEWGDDVLDGGAGEDYIDGDAYNVDPAQHGHDVLLGGAGNDDLVGNGGNDVLLGGDDDDRLTGDAGGLATQYHGNDFLDGGAGSDYLFGLGGDDVLFGGDGNDFLYGGAGRDVLYGGAGTDQLVGDADADLLYAGAGDDVVTGDDGDDVLDGEEGNDTLLGGAGNDIIYANLGDDLVAGDDGDDLIFGEDGADTIDGGAGNDEIYGGAGANRLLGGAGNDILFGWGGDDLLDGGDGNDHAEGGSGKDLVFGGSGADWLGGNSQDDVVQGDIGDDSLYGEDGNDVLWGDAGDDDANNDANDAADNDWLDGGNGRDTVEGQSGTKVLLLVNRGPANVRCETKEIESDSRDDETYSLQRAA